MRREIPYQVIGGTKFYERAEIKDAIAYLTVLTNPQDAISLHARRQLAPARDRADLPVAGPRPRRHDGHPGLGRGGRSRERARPGHGGDQGVRALHGARWRRCGSAPRKACRSATCSRRSCTSPATSRRWRPSGRSRPQGRLENLQELVEVGREFDARAEAEGDTLDDFLQQISLDRRRRHAPRRRGHGDADDAAQREGPRVPDRLHHRLRGGRLPALAARSTRAASRRSAASATSASPGRCATCT